MAKDDPPTWVAQYEDASGKGRRKSFKQPAGRLTVADARGFAHLKAYQKALAHLINKERFVVRAPQAGPVRWMGRITAKYRGAASYCRLAGDKLLVVGTDLTHAHTLDANGSGSRTFELPDAPGNVTSARVAPVGDDALLLVHRSLGRDDGGRRVAAHVYRASLAPTGLDFTALLRLEGAHEKMANALASSAADIFITSHPEGVGLFESNGTTLASWLGRSAAISRSGEFIAVATPDAIDVYRSPNWETPQFTVEKASPDSFCMMDSGELTWSGTVTEEYGTFAAAMGGQATRLGRLGRPVLDGRTFLAANGVAMCLSTLDDDGIRTTRQFVLPAGLGCAKTASLTFIDASTALFGSDAYTFGALAIAELESFDHSPLFHPVFPDVG